jgi:uncharacterized integral membrane protein (TIGR00698 family)
MTLTRPRIAVAPRHELVPGLVAAGVGVAVAWSVHLVLPPVALLTASVLAGVVAANVGVLPEPTRAGLGFAGKHLMRAGVVLLGLQVSVTQIAGLGWQTVAMTLGVLFTTFFGTQWIGRRLGLSDRLSLLVASGFAICGASAVAAVSGAIGGTRDDEDEDTVTAVALVALCGSMAIAVLPLANHALGLSPHDFGRWAGASVHDVGQVVATASIVGPSALAPAVAVKLIRVAMLAPITAGVGAAHRHRPGRPPLPLFVAGFLALIAVRTTGAVPARALDLAHTAQDLLFAFALFGLGAFVRIRSLLGTGRRALLLGFGSWALIALVSYIGIRLTS